MKIALVLYIAAILSDDKLGKKSMGWFGLVTVLVPVGAVFASLAVQKHTSGIVIMGAIAVAMMFFGGIKMSIFATTLGVGAGAAVTMIAVFPHARQRVMTYLQSSFGNSSETLDTSGDGYQIQNSLRAIGSGGLFGRGYGKSIQKYLYLPESYNDFIFAIIAEELGFVGVVIVITLFVLLVCRGYKAAAYSSDKFASMVAAGISTIIGLQAVMNISVVSGVIPVTGVALPFFSYGGTSLIMIMGAMGILLNIAKQSEYIKF
jgi:cell division protein FtsW